VKAYFEKNNEKKKLISYDIHDGKMLYLLAQHSHFTRKNYPFLLCKCKRGDGCIKKITSAISLQIQKLFSCTYYLNQSLMK
jgi:hypothetical protein